MIDLSIRKNNTNIAEAGQVVSTLVNEKVYILRNKFTNKYLDVANGGTTNGTNIQQYAFNFTNSQKFKIVRIGDSSPTVYEIIPIVNLNLRLDVANGVNSNGTTIQLYQTNSSSSQRFSITSAGNGAFKILTQLSNYSKCVTVSSSDVNYADVCQWDYAGYSCNQWYFEEAYGDQISVLEQNKAYYIRNNFTNKYMDVSDGGITNGTNIQQYQFNSTPSQIFMLKCISGNEYEIVPMLEENQRLDVSGGVNANGTNIQLYRTLSSNAQKFQILSLSNGSYKILTKTSGYTKCVTVSSTDPNASNVNQWDYFDHPSSQWYFEDVFSNFEKANYVAANQTKSLKFTFPDDKYYNIELSGDNVDTRLTLNGYQSNNILVNNGGIGETDKICIKGIQGKTITATINILNGQSAGTIFRICKMRAVMYGRQYYCPTVYDTSNFIDTPNDNMNNVCLSLKYKNKNENHLTALDERYIPRLNSDIVYLVGDGNDIGFDTDGNGNSGLMVDEINNLDKCKFIFFSSPFSAYPDSTGFNLVTKAIYAGAKTAMGLTNTGYSVTAQKSFGEWLFYYLRVENNTIAQAAAISKTAIEGDGMSLSYDISGDREQILFPNAPSYRLCSIANSSLGLSAEQVQEMGYIDIMDIGNNIVRYCKKINGIRTDDFYDFMYDESGELWNISHSKNTIADQEILPIIILQTEEAKTSEFFNNNYFTLSKSNRIIKYRNINNIMTPVEINFNNYEDEKGYGYQDVKCYNLYDGSEIDFADIINLK